MTAVEGTFGGTPRIGVCLFGITRSLRHTVASIERNVMAPARAAGSVRVYGHFFTEQEIDSAWSGESGRLDPEEHRLIDWDWLELEPPGRCLSRRHFMALKAHGDAFDNGFASLRNLVHQLHSLDSVTRAALADGAEVVLFCRPDLAYHDSLAAPLAKALGRRGPGVLLPYWHPCGGENDRFALAVGAPAIAAYGSRIDLARRFCERTGGPLHSERLVRYALREAAVPVRRIPTRATRIRLGGTPRAENFDHPVETRLKATLGPVLTGLNLKAPLRAGWRAIRRRPATPSPRAARDGD